MLRRFYGPNDFVAGLPSPPNGKQFDCHHSADKIWLTVINQSNVYFEFYYPEGQLAGAISENSGGSFLLNPRPQFVLVVAVGNGIASVFNTSLFLGIDTQPMISSTYQLHIGA